MSTAALGSLAARGRARAFLLGFLVLCVAGYLSVASAVTSELSLDRSIEGWKRRGWFRAVELGWFDGGAVRVLSGDTRRRHGLVKSSAQRRANIAEQQRYPPPKYA